MRIAFAFAFYIISTVANAQTPQAPQVFVPFTVTEQDARDLRAFLDEQQMKVGLPILKWMEQLEQRAIKSAEASKEPKEPADK